MTFPVPAHLDSAVATALGHQVLGLHWAKPVEDSPEWEPCPESRGVELRPLLVGPRCHCGETPDERDELHEQMYGFTRFNGHTPFCVVVAPRYSTDPAAMMLVLEWLRWNSPAGVTLGMAQHHPNMRGRCWCRLGAIEDDVIGDSLPECVARACVEWVGRNKTNLEQS